MTQERLSDAQPLRSRVDAEARQPQNGKRVARQSFPLTRARHGGAFDRKRGYRCKAHNPLFGQRHVRDREV